MRGLFHFALLVALASPLPGWAQMRGSSPPPPASIYSMGGTSLGPPPASIYSQPTRPAFCCGAAINFGRGQVGGIPFSGRRHHSGRNHLGTLNGPFFLPYAINPYYSDYPVEMAPPDQEIDNGGTFQSRRGDQETYAPPAPTIFENRPGAPYRPSGDYLDEQRDDARYGTHYLDSRERSREKLEPRDADRRDRAQETPETVAEVIPTVLVFRDGRQQEITNYAIMGKTLFVLSGERAKIPVSDLDIEATIAANDKRGNEFRVPKN